MRPQHPCGRISRVPLSCGFRAQWSESTDSARSCDSATVGETVRWFRSAQIREPRKGHQEHAQDERGAHNGRNAPARNETAGKALPGPVGSRSAPPTVQGHSLMAKAADGRRRRSATAAAVTLCLTVDSSQRKAERPFQRRPNDTIGCVPCRRVAKAALCALTLAGGAGAVPPDHRSTAAADKRWHAHPCTGTWALCRE